MRRRRAICEAAAAALVGMGVLAPGAANAVDTVSFSSSDVGSTHAVGTWTDDFGNLQTAADTMGSSLSSYGTDFNMGLPLNADGTLTAAQKTWIDNQAATIRASGRNLSVFMGPTVGNTDPSYEYATYGNVNVSQWVAAITAYKNYWQSLGFTVSAAVPFNEPDYWSGQGSPAQLAQIMQALHADPGWKGIQLQGGTTLSAANAQTWFNAVAGTADAGATHLLGGTLANYDAFIQSVQSTGTPFAAPELHSMAEAIVSANYNAVQAGWWATPYLARGTFSQASAGKRLGYSVNFGQETAAAVYRGTDGSTYAFAGGLERSGGPDTYRFVSADRAVYVNGIGPITSYSMQAGSDADAAVTSNQLASFGQYFDQGAMAKVDYGAASVPALDGYRWEVQNVQTGQLLGVAGGATGNNALVNTAAAAGSTAQMWDVTRLQDGYLTFFNDNSGRVVAVSGATQAAGGSVLQYDSVSSLDQQWYLAPAGNGAFYIKDGNSGYYLTGNPTNCTQQALAGGTLVAAQQWRFVAVNPTQAARASYALNGNANDGSGNGYNGTVTGTAAYTAGPTAGSRALVFDGSSTYVTLPSAVSNTSAGIVANYSSGITVDAWVKWNGGGNWQRVFDFGTGTNAYMFLTPESAAGTMRFGITSAGTAEEEDVDTDPLTTGQWVNLAVTLGGHSAVIYVNGKPAAAGSVLINPTYVNATNDYIGKSQFAGDPLFNGSVSQFAVYNYALTPTQVADLLNHNLVWTGGQNGGTWDNATTANFSLNGSSAVYTPGDRVTFDGTGTGTVNLSGTLSPFSVTVSSNAAVTFAGTGSIAGPTALTKPGAGTLTVNPSNSYTGGTAISGGTVVMANAAALGTGGIDLIAGGTLTATNFSGGAPTVGNTVYGDGGTLAAASGTTLTLAGNLAGSGSLALTTTDSSAVLRLTGNNSTFAGNAVVNGANVRLAAATAGSGSALWTVNTALQLDVAGGATYPLGALAGAGVIAGHAVNAASTASTLVVGGAGTVAVFAGQIADNAGGGVNNVVGLTVAGTGTQILSGSNTYSGPTLISSGTLVLGNGGTTGSVSLAGVLTDNGTLGFNRSNSLTEGVDFNPINGTGGLLQAGTGTLTLKGANGYAGGTTIAAGTVSVSDDANLGANGSAVTLAGGTLATTAYVYDTHPVTVGLAGGTIDVTTGGQYFFNIANLLRGNGTLTLAGTGTLTPGVGNLRLAQANTFGGAVVLQQGGILEYGQNGAIGSSAGVTIADQGELAVQGGFAVTVPNPITVAGSTNAVLSFENGAAGNVSGGVTVNGTLTVGLRDWYNNATARSGTIGGVIAGPGGLAVNSGTAAAPGTLTLTAANTFAGNVTVANATVVAAYGANDFNAGGRPTGALGNEQTAGRTVTINGGGTVSLAVGNVLGSGGSSPAQAPALRFVVNAGGTLQTAAPNVGGTGGGDANILGPVTLNGGTLTTGNGYNAQYQAAILLGTVTVGGTTPSTINTAATNTTANGVQLSTANTTFAVAITGAAAADLTVSAVLADAPGGPGGLTKAGPGTMLLAGTAVDTYTGPTNVSAGTLEFGPGAAGGGYHVQPLPGGLTVAAGGRVALAASVNTACRTLLAPTGLSVAVGGALDLANNDLDVVDGSLAAVTALAAAGFAGGTWSGGGLTSSVAAADPAHLTGVGVIVNRTPTGSALYASFDGQPVSATDVLARYTYYGDTNLDGVVNAADYTRVDAGYVGHLSGWANGDFNYDGTVDGTDYALMDNAFDQQPGGGVGTPALASAEPTATPLPAVVAVPEPAGVVVAMGAGLVAVRGRRRRAGGRSSGRYVNGSGGPTRPPENLANPTRGATTRLTSAARIAT